MSTTETKKRIQKPCTEFSEATDQLESETAKTFGVADELLKFIIAGERDPRFDELNYFRNKCGWSDREISRELSRMRFVMRCVDAVGTAEGREAAKLEQTHAQELLNNESPKLEAKIAELQSQLAEMKRRAADATRRCESIDIALGELLKPENARQDFRDRYHGKLRDYGESAWKELKSVEQEIQFRQQIVGDKLTFDTIKFYWPGCIAPRPIYGGDAQVDQSKWANERQRAKDELPELERRRDELEEQKRRDLEELQQYLTHYIQ